MLIVLRTWVVIFGQLNDTCHLLMRFQEDTEMDARHGIMVGDHGRLHLEVTIGPRGYKYKPLCNIARVPTPTTLTAAK